MSKINHVLCRLAWNWGLNGPPRGIKNCIMDIVIMGAGNVAHCFGHLMKLHGHHVKQVISRSKAHAGTWPSSCMRTRRTT